MNTVATSRARFQKMNSLRIVSLLKMLGVPESMLSRRKQRKDSLWLRPVNHLQILEHARQSYRAQIRHAHPDAGGSAARAVELNHAWRHVQKRFRENGYELGR